MTSEINIHTINDTPTHRVSIDELSTEQLDALLDGIRERRLSIARKVAEQSIEREESRRHVKCIAFMKLRTRLMDKCVKMEEQLGKLENEVNKLRALRLEIEG